MAPVLLFGMPRSGTTWIGKIFDSHPDTVYCHEPDTAYPLKSLPMFPVAADVERYRGFVREYADSIRRMRSVRVFGKMPLFAKSYRSDLGLLVLRGSVAASKLAGKLVGELPVLAQVPREDGVLVWKSIESLGRLGLFASCLPDARAIHIVRHPCGYVASVLRGESQNRFSSKTADSEDVGLYEKLVTTEIAAEMDLTVERLMALQPHERLAWRWFVYNEKAFRDLAGSARYYRVIYDDVCNDALAQSRALFDFAGLEWAEQTERFVEASTGKHNSEYYSVFKDPRLAAERWRKDLAPEIIEDVLAIASRGRVGEQFAA